VAAGSKPPEEFRVYDVERAESGGQGLWFGHKCVRCESVDCGFAAVGGGAESVSVGALVRDTKPIGGCNSRPVWVRVRNTALVGRLGTESDRAIRRPAVIAKRQPTFVIAKRQPAFLVANRQPTVIVTKRQPTVVITERQPAEFIRIIRRKRVQRRKRRQGVNASGELSRIDESRRGRRGQQGWWWASLSYAK